jgi:hypothetical protein
VAFGGVWKDSLSELSGGQKSLLALSLILAMLLFKPAPIYILDEVDAALDLSHTQNIGRMIKTHFPQSQVGCSGWGAVGWVCVGGWMDGCGWVGGGAAVEPVLPICLTAEAAPLPLTQPPVTHNAAAPPAPAASCPCSSLWCR